MAAPNQKSRRTSDPLGPCEPLAARAALNRVLASPAFVASENLSRFLRHLAEQTIEGRTEGLKEYTLGVDVLGRPESFDPRIDSIVRVEASRLRKRLASHYASSGSDDPVRISLPPGSYVPIFRPSTSNVPAARKSRWQWATTTAAIVLVLIAAVWLVARFSSSLLPGIHRNRTTMAILPFVSLSGTVEDERLADAITSDTTALLAEVEEFQIVARSSALLYTGRNVDLRQAGRELGVATVVEGTISRLGRQIRVTARVANTSDGFQRWQRSWEVPDNDGPRIHEEIARGIARALEAPPPGEGSIFRNRTARNPEAYRLAIEARYLANTTPENAAIRIDHYKRALNLDPDYVPAWLGIADTWGRLANAADAPPRSVIPAAREAVSKALELDPALPDSHLLAANLYWSFDWDWQAADREFRRAIELDPDSGTTRNFYAQYLAHMGRFAEALKQVEILRTLEPLSPASRTMEANVLYLSRQFERTIRLCEETLRNDRRAWGLHYWLARAYESQGEHRESLAILERLHPPGELAGRGFGVLGVLYGRMGRHEAARDLLIRALDRGKRRYVSPVSIAQVHIGLGELDHAFEWLQKGYTDRDATMTSLKVEPVFDPIRADPRFVSLLRRLGLE